MRFTAGTAAFGSVIRGRPAVWAAIVSLPLGFALTERVLSSVASSAPADPHWHGRLSLFPLSLAQVPLAAFAVFALISLAGTAALAVLWSWYSKNDVNGTDRWLLSAAVLAMCAIGFTADASTSADVYAYVAYGFMPHPYQPAALSPNSPFVAAEAMWGQPVIACVYGPVWVALNHLVLLHAASWAEAVFRLRLLSLVALVVLAGTLRWSGARLAIIVLLLLNPGFWRLWIADVHMDLPAVVMVVAAGTLALRGRLGAAVPLLVLAGLYKISLGAIGLAVITHHRAMTRVAVATASAIGIGVLSWILGGAAYYDAIRDVGRANTSFGLVGTVHVVVVGCAVVAVAAAALGGRVWRAATWTQAAIGANLAPWYAGWCLPYALRSRYASSFFILFPFVAATVGTYSPVIGYAVLAGVTVAAMRGRADGALARPGGGGST